jgi:hypothetical protein
MTWLASLCTVSLGQFLGLLANTSWLLGLAGWLVYVQYHLASLASWLMWAGWPVWAISKKY